MIVFKFHLWLGFPVRIFLHSAASTSTSNQRLVQRGCLRTKDNRTSLPHPGLSIRLILFHPGVLTASAEAAAPAMTTIMMMMSYIFCIRVRRDIQISYAAHTHTSARMIQSPIEWGRASLKARGLAFSPTCFVVIVIRIKSSSGP